MTALADRQSEFCSYLAAGFPTLALVGMPMRSAAAIGGNATQENLCQPVTAGAKDHGSDGTLQWRLERLDGPDGLKEWCQTHGLAWDTLKGQAAFTLHELCQLPYAVLHAELLAGAKSLETLTLNFCDAFERPSEAGRQEKKRIEYAHDCLAIMMRDAPAPAPAPSTVPAPPPSPLPPIGSLQMPIELILQLVAPLAESLVSGLLKGVLTHVQTNGIPASPASPIAHPAAPAATAAPVIDFAALEPIIAKLVAAEITKLGKPA